MLAPPRWTIWAAGVNQTSQPGVAGRRHPVDALPVEDEALVLAPDVARRARPARGRRPRGPARSAAPRRGPTRPTRTRRRAWCAGATAGRGAHRPGTAGRRRTSAARRRGTGGEGWPRPARGWSASSCWSAATAPGPDPDVGVADEERAAGGDRPCPGCWRRAARGCRRWPRGGPTGPVRAPRSAVPSCEPLSTTMSSHGPPGGWSRNESRSPGSTGAEFHVTVTTETCTSPRSGASAGTSPSRGRWVASGTMAGEVGEATRGGARRPRW